MKIIIENFRKFAKGEDDIVKEYEEEPGHPGDVEGHPLIVAANDALYALWIAIEEDGVTKEMSVSGTTIEDLRSKMRSIDALVGRKYPKDRPIR